MHWASLTSNEAGDLLGIFVVGNSPSSRAHAPIHVGEGQKFTAVVVKPRVDLQQTLVSCEVSEECGFALLWTVHLADVKESCERVDLLTDGPGTEHEASVAGTTSWSRAEEGHAFIWVGAKARILTGDLFRWQENG